MLQGIFDIFGSVSNAISGIIDFFASIGEYIGSFFEELGLFFKALFFSRSLIDLTLPYIFPGTLVTLFLGAITIIFVLRIVGR